MIFGLREMQDPLIPIVPFGKYKGKSVTDVLLDIKYVNWLKNQTFFKKYEKSQPVLYNIVVNQSLPGNNVPSKTPHHNKLQNLFLCDENKALLVEKLFRIKDMVFPYGIDFEFEGIFNWDLVLKNIIYNICKCRDNGSDYCTCPVVKNKSLCNVYCEIKPLLGDDYPEVLRKMKVQIERTNNRLNKDRDDSLKLLGHNKKKRCCPAIYGENFEEISELLNSPVTGSYVLLIENFSSNTSKSQLQTIFKNSGITVLFFDEIKEKKPLVEAIDYKSKFFQLIDDVKNNENTSIDFKILYDNVNKIISSTVSEICNT